MRFRFALGVALAAALLLPTSASAAFHLMKVSEVFPGDSARPTSQYVELQMYASGQNQVGGHSVTVYNDLGTENSTATFPSSVPNSQNQRTILVASPDFAGEFGITPDLEISAPMMDAAGGAVCFDGVDCVSWGSFAGFDPGPAPSPVGSNAAAIPDGMSLTRSIARNCATLLESADDTDDSGSDFAAVAPTPRNNATSPTEVECSDPDPDPDTTVDGAQLSAKKTQRTSKRKPAVVAKAKLAEDGSVKVVAKAKVGKKTYKMKKSASLSAGKRAKLKIKAKGKAKKKIGKALRKGRRVRVKITGTFTDAAGNKTTEKAAAKLK